MAPQARLERPAFEAAAATYDANFTHSAIGRLQRQAVHEHLRRHVLAGAPTALDLGCGTGEDALFLARNGCHVLATDAAPAMLEQARAKTAAAGLAERVRVLPLDLTSPPAELPGGPVELLLSNFGALNCLSPTELGHLGRTASAWVRPGGRAVLVVMPRFCLLESVSFALRGGWGQATRRWRGGPVEALVPGGQARTWYYSPRQVEAAFAAAFRPRRRRPVGLCVPPSYLERQATLWPRTLGLLAAVDRALAGCGVLAGLADHALVELERR